MSIFYFFPKQIKMLKSNLFVLYVSIKQFLNIKQIVSLNIFSFDKNFKKFG